MAHEGQTSFPVSSEEDIKALLDGLGLTGKPLPGPLFGPKQDK